MANNNYANQTPQSRVEEILEAIINESDYDQPAQSRVEYLLKQILGLLSGKADLDENGLIPVSEIPPEAFEYMIDVADDISRFALTTDDVQKGDIVRVISTGIMYFVVDTAHLDTESGYKPFAAGIVAKAIGDEDGNNIKSTYQTKITSTNKVSADNVDDSNTTNKFTTTAEKQAWNGKQDALTFNGTYDSATNPAATVSTITNAINDLDVTGDSNVPASKTVKSWSEENGKVNVTTQDIAIDSSQVNAMSGYAKGQADSAITTSDTLNEAVGKLEYKTDVNKTNILSEQAKTTGMTEGGSNYITVGGIRVYVSSTAPTGDIPDGSVGVGW